MSTPVAEQQINVAVAAKPASRRMNSIDALRGLVMVFMCLDHTREFFGDLRVAPEELETTTPLLFFTRWITHFCAPTFVFLAGVSAWFYGQNVGNKHELASFLLTRGLWLVFLEFTVVYFGWMQCVGYFPLMFIVIGAIGVSMMALAALIWLPYWMIACVGIGIVALHNCLDGLTVANPGLLSDVWAIVHKGGSLDYIESAIRIPIEVGYPILAWIGVIACGYAFGRVLQQDPLSRSRACFITGTIGIALFVILRAVNGYGDPQPWSPQSSDAFTLLSFLKCSKYPPSLLYLLMTLGPALIVLGLFDRWFVNSESIGQPEPRALSALLVFGRVPLFFYVVHLYLIHTLDRLLYWVARGEPVSPLQIAFDCFGNEKPFPEIYGFDVIVFYTAWPLMLLILWPLCRWFGQLKRNGKSWIWSYL